MKTNPKITLIGHLTKDIIYRDGQVIKKQVGGLAYYAGMTLARLGCSLTLLTKGHESDKAFLIRKLQKAGVQIIFQKSAYTSIFENHYSSKQINFRQQRVPQLAEPFTSQDIAQIVEISDCYLLGPLTQQDISLATFDAILEKQKTIVLDAQGYLRKVEAQKVIATTLTNSEKILSNITILKVDETEATLLTQTNKSEQAAQKLETLGVKEILITNGNKGSWLTAPKYNCYHQKIPAFLPKQLIDTTGCGDTYLAAYLSQRLQGMLPKKAAYFAAAAATLKLEHFGAFQYNKQVVNNRMNE